MQPTIELVGVDPANKGALLMLESAILALRGRYPRAHLVTSWRMPAAIRAHFALETMRPRDRMRQPEELAWRFLPDALKRLGGVVPRRQVDVVLDLSGFAYGDFWPDRKIEDRLLGPIDQRKGGRPRLILLPQAFGPFEDRTKADKMRRAVAGADLVFARDEVSYGHLRALGAGEAAPIRCAPDFTNTLEAAADSSPTGPALVIPNAKVTAGAGPEKQAAYRGFLARSVERLRERFQDVILLVHEGEGDRRIAEQVNEMLAEPAPIETPETARDTKERIAGASCVVSSRFHGLVSALSSGVPALACGWTHKYAELMRDYGQEAMMVDPERPEGWNEALDRLAEQASNGREALLERAQELKAVSKAMWDEVFAAIDAAMSAQKPAQ